MTLPRIAPYPVPAAHEVPAGRVTWRVDPARAALLVHDMQAYFVDAFAPGAPGVPRPVDVAIERITALRAAAAAHGMPVVYTVQPPDQSPADRGLLGEFWGPGLSGERTARVTDALAPGPDDLVVTKWRYNAFVRTPLLDLLAERGRDQVVVVGVYAHLGVLLTAGHAFMHDVAPFVVSDAVADFTRAHHEQALEYAATRCARVLTADDVLADLAGGADGPGATDRAPARTGAR